MSGAISPSASPRALILRWLGDDFDLVLSDAQLAEIVDVFGRSWLRGRYDVPGFDIDEFLEVIRAAPRSVPSPALPLAVRDPKDAVILATAFGGAADYLITGDDDLLILAGDPRLRSLQIVTASAFLTMLDQLTQPRYIEEGRSVGDAKTTAANEDSRGGRPGVGNVVGPESSAQGIAADVNGPFLGAFVLCEQAWRGEQWGSIDGIIDKLIVVSPEHATGVERRVLAILLYGRPPEAGWRIDVRVRWPDETSETLPVAQVVADDGEAGGVMIPIGVELSCATAGVVWFELLVDDLLLARVPFKIVHEWMSMINPGRR